MVAGLELHLREQLARAPFVLDALGHEPSQLLHATDERVALTLELLEPEQARTTRGLPRSHGRRRYVRKGFGDDARQLPLEPRHLHPQGVPRGALSVLRVEIDDWLLRLIGSHTRLLQIAR